MRHSILPAAAFALLVVAAVPARAQEKPAINLNVPLVSTTPPTAAQISEAAKEKAQPAPTPAAAGEPSIKIIEAFRHGNSTGMVLQSDRPLVVGADVYVGVQEVPANVGKPLSSGAGLWYYEATSAGSVKIAVGETASVTQKIKPTVMESISGALTQKTEYRAKYFGEITAVQGKRVMIDKGTLQEIHERDIYKIYDSSGNYKGMLEVTGIGDLQSSGKLFNAFEDRKNKVMEARVGDRVVFAGQRMQFGLGFEAGTVSSRPLFDKGREDAGGGGLLVNVTLRNGWGVEWLLGQYQRRGRGYGPEQIGDINPPFGPIGALTFSNEERAARYLAPIWLKKNFFYPSLVSPFLAAGAYWLQGYHSFSEASGNGATPLYTDRARRNSLYPTFGVGIDFLPTRLFRPRLDVRHFMGPNLGAAGRSFDTSITMYSLGVMMAW